MRGNVSLVVAIAMLAAACEPESSGTPGDAALLALTSAEYEDMEAGAAEQGETGRGTFRGLLVWGDEVRAFTPCGDSEAAWVIDSSGALWKLYREMASRPYQPLYAELQGELGPPPAGGFGDEYVRSLTVEQWLHLAVDTVGCVRKAEGATAAPGMDGLEFLAFGNEPFFTVSISRGEITFRELGSSDLVFPYATAELHDAVRIYRTRTDTPTAHEIRVEIHESECSDTMADALYSFTAEVLLDGRSYAGCARRGP